MRAASLALQQPADCGGSPVTWRNTSLPSGERCSEIFRAGSIRRREAAMLADRSLRARAGGIKGARSRLANSPRRLQVQAA